MKLDDIDKFMAKDNLLVADQTPLSFWNLRLWSYMSLHDAPIFYCVFFFWRSRLHARKIANVSSRLCCRQWTYLAQMFLPTRQLKASR